MTEKLLTLREVAEHLAVTPQSVYNWIRMGKIRGLKVGRVWRFTQSEIERFACPSTDEQDLPAGGVESLERMERRFAKAQARGFDPRPFDTRRGEG